jgi:hypothetical protein
MIVYFEIIQLLSSVLSAIFVPQRTAVEIVYTGLFRPATSTTLMTCQITLLQINVYMLILFGMLYVFNIDQIIHLSNETRYMSIEWEILCIFSESTYMFYILLW